jgi:hypothetical protein
MAITSIQILLGAGERAVENCVRVGENVKFQGAIYIWYMIFQICFSRLSNTLELLYLLALKKENPSSKC